MKLGGIYYHQMEFTNIDLYLIPITTTWTFVFAQEDVGQIMTNTQLNYILERKMNTFDEKKFSSDLDMHLFETGYLGQIQEDIFDKLHALLQEIEHEE